MNRIYAEHGYDFEGIPFSPAAGAINGVNEEEIIAAVKDVLRSPAEAVKWGSTTWNGGAGNALDYDPVYNHNALTGQTVNSIGLANIGHEKAKRLQQEMQEWGDEVGKPVIPSISPGKGEDPLEVLPAMAYGFAEHGVRILEVNYSCPNKIVDGSPSREPILGHDLEVMEAIDQKIVEAVGTDITVIRKLPPYVAEKKILIPEVGKVFARADGKAALNVSNTVGGQAILTELGDPALGVPGNLGGMSGPATIEIGRDQLRRHRKVTPEHVGMISCLGIGSGREIYKRVHEMGADSTEAVTPLWENQRRHGMSFGQTITRFAEQYAQTLEEPSI